VAPDAARRPPERRGVPAALGRGGEPREGSPRGPGAGAAPATGPGRCHCHAVVCISPGPPLVVITDLDHPRAAEEEAALGHALQEGWIAAAGLDVLEQEPPAPDNPLLGMQTVMLTPHAAFCSRGALTEVKRRAAAAVAAVLRGAHPESVVHPEAYARTG